MWLIVGDLHLTDNARDSHRFRIFDWIARQQAKRETAATFLLGDITDSKDRHSATLVNKIVAGLVSLKPPVYVLKGNHDYSDPKNPFFKFLNHIEGINFIIEPTVIKAIKPIALIPHFRKQDEFDQAIQDCVDKPICGNVRGTPACFLVHQTFDGAIAESGVRLSGLSAAHINFLKPRLGVYAGDVHRPQTQGPVTYVGCPYQVRFGDNFEPRSLWLDDKGRRKELRFNAPRKWSLTVRGPENVLSHEELCEGDQVKLTIEVAREEAVEWKSIKQEVLAACKELKLEVYGVKLEVKTGRSHKRPQIQDIAPGPVLTFERFCKDEKVPSQIKKVGMELVNGN
jgi:hypothetical protein